MSYDIRCRLVPLEQQWHSFKKPDPAAPGRHSSFVDWLPSFYDSVLSTVNQEVKNCGLVTL